MFKSAVRAAPRRFVPIQSPLKPNSSRRFLSTARASQKPRSWKGSVARWAIAGGAVYYYNTSNIFAEEPEVLRLEDSIHHIQESSQPTVDAVVEEKRRRAAERAAEEERLEQAAQAATQSESVGDKQTEIGGLDSAEEEAESQGAFNPETGEINWDCPCLGGMAHGPCGEEFRAAFSCFVYSDQEPKGVECIDKFQGMQNCFRQHPDMYGSELDDDEDEIEEELHARQQSSAADEQASQKTPEQKQERASIADEVRSQPSPASPQEHISAEKKVTPQPSPKEAEATPTKTTTISENKPASAHHDSQATTLDEAQKAGDESGELIPKQAYDASSK